LLLYSFFDYVRIGSTTRLLCRCTGIITPRGILRLTAVRGHPASTLTQLGIKTFPLRCSACQ